MKAIYFVAIFMAFSSSFLILNVYGDGLASETLPPSLIGKTNVTLSIGSVPFLIDNNHAGTQLNLVLMDADTQQPIPDATLAISAFKGQSAVFGHIFKSDSGNFILNFYPEQSGNITFNEEGGMLSGLFGQDSGNYQIKGPIFSNAGLYRFKIEVITMGAYDNQVSKSYAAGISIPEYNNLTITDPTYGTHQVQIIAYYDQIHDVKYDQTKKAINFTMPFDWSNQNIDQLTVVHQEIRIPRDAGNLVVTKYDAYVNNIKIPDKLISIDDYSMDAYRIVHLILYKKDVQTLLSEQKDPGQDMRFSLRPSDENAFPVVQFTRNAQFKVALSWDPPKILAGSTTRFTFQVEDPYTMNRTVASIPYDFSVLEGKNGVIYHEVGRTLATGNTASVSFPANYTGSITIAFENLNDSSFASTEFPATVSSPSTQTTASAPSTVPEFPIAPLAVFAAMVGLSLALTRARPYSKILP
ncbi:MAG TPA: hypothetical protein VJ792_09040 [Candidatus Nitrosotalea sp.]|nr:hypothetical protein [Candidatus Nitrosotalea sp.]